MKIESTITTSVKDIKRWISKSRAKTNKKIKSLVQGYEESPLVEKKRKVLAPLFVNSRNSENKKEK